MGFPRQEYWSGLPVPPSGDLVHTGMKPTSPALQVDSLAVGSPFPLLIRIEVWFSGLGKDLWNTASSQRDFQHLLASWPIITTASAKIPCPKFMNISSAAA